ncbi:MAG: PIN domain-containing protein [Beijerinckiaceae bacterium]
MLRYMLDTNICSYVMRQRPQTLRDRFNEEAERMCISAITLGDLLYGAEANSSVRPILEQFLARITPLDFGYAAAAHYAQIRVELKKQPIGANEALIAAHARSEGLTIVTNNAREFQRVPGLRIENWTT